MSISFLKPCVTPCTALATSARARPCTARCSSDSRLTLSTPSFCSNEIPRGTATLSLPLGPWTSILSEAMAILTPEGTEIGLFPIRDICLFQPLKISDYKNHGYQTSQINSQPTLFLRAARPLINPCGVVRMLMPNPPTTGLISCEPTYRRWPGRE